MKKESFIIYTSFYEPIKFLNDEQLGKLFRAIFQYQIEGNTECDNDIKMAFEFFKNQFAVDEKKYEKVLEKRSYAGKKGMEKRWGKDNTCYKKNNTCYENDNKCYKNDNKLYQTITNITDNVNVNVNDNENDNVNENDNDNVNVNDNIIDCYCQNIGNITPNILEQLKGYLKDKDGEIKIKGAINRANEAGVRNFNYIKAILKNWYGKSWNEVLDEQERYENKNVRPEPSWLHENFEPIDRPLNEEERKLYEELMGEGKK